MCPALACMCSGSCTQTLASPLACRPAVKSSNVLLTATGSAKLADVSSLHAVAVTCAAMCCAMLCPQQSCRHTIAQQSTSCVLPLTLQVGVSRMQTRTYLSETMGVVGTWAWIAPEVLMGCRCTLSVDLYRWAGRPPAFVWPQDTWGPSSAQLCACACTLCLHNSWLEILFAAPLPPK